MRGSLRFGVMSKKWRRLQRIYMKPQSDSQLPLDWWIAGGYPPNPYKRGVIVGRLMEKLRPKNLQLPPEEVVQEAERVYLERTLYRNWLAQWLQSVRDYALLFTVEEASIERVLAVPVCAHSWRKTQFSDELMKFRLLWKAVDWYTEMPDYWAYAIGSTSPVGSFVASGAVHFYSPQFHLVTSQVEIIEYVPTMGKGYLVVRDPNS